MFIEYEVVKQEKNYEKRKEDYLEDACKALEQIKGIKNMNHGVSTKNTRTYKARKLEEDSVIQDTLIQVVYDEETEDTIISLNMSANNFDETKKSMNSLTVKIREELNKKGLGII